MNTAATPANRSITQSPWYWAYIFCTGGLIALVVMGPRYAQRQAQIERNGQARQRAAQLAAGATPPTPTSANENLSVALWPLFVVLGAVLAFAWIKLIRDHLKNRSLTNEPAPGLPRDPSAPVSAVPVSADTDSAQDVSSPRGQP